MAKKITMETIINKSLAEIGGKKVADLADKFWVIEDGGRTYVLLEAPYMTNHGSPAVAVYEAHAIRLGDEYEEETAEEWGYTPIYEIRWDILPDWNGKDVADACTWYRPAEVRSIGGEY